MFDFTLPLSQKTLTWKPLTVGQQLDAEAANRNNKIALTVDMFARRVLTYDGKQGLTVGQLRDWDQIDFDAFTDHVNEAETTRAAKFKKPMLAGDAILMLEQAKSVIDENVKAIGDVIDGAITILRESGSASPLK